jgi:hypothetical protein
MQENLPFWEMQPADELLSGESPDFGGGQVFAKAGQAYAIYLPTASNTGTLDLSGSFGTFALDWFNPRTGQFEGSAQIIGGGAAPLGAPPSSASEDWVALLKPIASDGTAPAAPSNLNVAADARGPLQVSWTDNAGDESGFAIERASAGGSFATLATVGADVTEYADEYVVSGVSYSYRVRAYNAAGASEYSNVADGMPSAAVLRVMQLMLINAASDQEIWPLSNGARVNFQEVGTQLNIRADVAGSVAKVVFGLDGKASYRSESTAPYALAGDSNGNYGAWKTALGAHTVTAMPYDSSGVAGAAMTVQFMVVDEAPGTPAAPTSLSATLSGSAVELAWVDHADDETGIVIERSRNSGAFAVLATIGAGESAYTDAAIAAGDSYVYRVRAVNGSLSSAYSNTASVTIPVPPPTQPPAAATSLSAAAVSSSQINLSWSHDGQIVDGFVVERSMDGISNWQTIATTAKTARTYSDAGLAADTQYFYRVSAFNVVGSSAATAVASARTQLAPLGPAVVRLVLVNAATDTDLMVLSDGVIDLSDLGTTQLNIRAEVTGGVQSVRFALNSKSNFRTESSAPFAMWGDSNGNYAAWTPALNTTYTITATPYTRSSAKGTAGTAVTVSIRFVA